jgi:hypothetical protein
MMKSGADAEQEPNAGQADFDICCLPHRFGFASSCLLGAVTPPKGASEGTNSDMTSGDQAEMNHSSA